MGRILVADDHDSLRRGIVRALSDAHHEVDEAPNGNVAIEKLHEGQYDVVLSDLKMGGSDGMDVLRTAKSLQPNTAVILMTAFGSIHTAVEAMKIGAFDYVQKPFEIEEMELKIAKAIEHRRLRHEIEYLKPLRWRPEPVHIDLWITTIKGARIDVGYEVYDEHPGQERVRYALAESTLVIYDLVSERPKRISAADVERLEALRGEPVPFRMRRSR